MSRNPSDATVKAWTRLVRARETVLGAIERDLKATDCPPLAWYDVLLELVRAPKGPLRPFEIEKETPKQSFGVVGSPPRHKEQSHATPQEARAGVEELIADKLDDGFVEVDRLSLQPLAPVAEAAAPAPEADRPAGVRRFELVEGTSSKFWEVWVTGNEMTTRWGRIGTEGQTKAKPFADEAAARKAAER